MKLVTKNNIELLVGLLKQNIKDQIDDNAPDLSNFITEAQAKALIQGILAGNEDLEQMIRTIVSDSMDAILAGISDNVTQTQVEATIATAIAGLDTALRQHVSESNQATRDWVSANHYSRSQTASRILDTINMLDLDLKTTGLDLTIDGALISTIDVMTSNDVIELFD